MKTGIKLIVGAFALGMSASLFADDSSVSINKSLQVSAATSTAFVPSLFESPVFDVLNKTATSTEMLLNSNKSIQHEPSDDKEVDWIVVRFKSEAGIRIRDNALKQVDLPGKARLSSDKKMAYELNLNSLKQSLQLHKRPIERYFGDIPETEVDWMQKEGERRSKTKLQNLNDYYRIPYEEGTRYKTAKNLLKNLAENPLVEVSYTDARSNYVSTGYETGQFIHDGPSYGGVNAEAAWDEYGADARGANVNVGIIEAAFVKSHVDFPTNLIWGFEAFASDPSKMQGLIDSYNYYSENPGNVAGANHGNNVSGILLAQDNGFGRTGIVPEASFALQGGGSPCGMISIVAARMDYSGVVNVSFADYFNNGDPNHPYNNYHVPIDSGQACFDIIQNITAMGVIVIIGVGNFHVNLDDPLFGGLFDPTIRDSGAIVAGASYIDLTPYTSWFPWGDRIDAFTPDGLVSLGIYNDYPSGGFTGTSATTAAVSGAVAAIQSVANGVYEITLTAREMRSIIKHEGTTQSGTFNKPIGWLPNILKGAQVGIPRIISQRGARVPPNYLLLLDN